jgi:hypothetical protein
MIFAENTKKLKNQLTLGFMRCPNYEESRISKIYSAVPE